MKRPAHPARGAQNAQNPPSLELPARVAIPRSVAQVQEVPLVRCQEEVDELREAAAKRDKAFSDPTSENKVDYDECRFEPNRPNKSCLFLLTLLIFIFRFIDCSFY